MTEVDGGFVSRPIFATAITETQSVSQSLKESATTITTNSSHRSNNDSSHDGTSSSSNSKVDDATARATKFRSTTVRLNPMSS